MHFKTALLLIILPSIVLASPAIISKQKNEMNGEITYQYFQTSSNEKDEHLKITCNPSGGLDLQFCYKSYYSRTLIRCHLDYNFKLDNNPIEKKTWSNKPLKSTYSENKAFIKRLIKHNKIVIQEFKGGNTPVFDIRNLRNKIKEFSHQCPINIDNKKTNKKRNTISTIHHTHNNRSHTHPLPPQGIAHKHGNGAIGK